MRIGEHDVVLPTLPEVLRIKAYLSVTRNATRDYIDLAALAAHMGIAAAARALLRMDELYPQRNGDAWAVRTQLVVQLAAPPPRDLPGDDLGEYRGLRPPFNRWSHVADVCAKLSERLLAACLEALRADASPAAPHAQTKIGTWREARAARETPPLGKLPGLAR
jgi:hypothetical protein